ncbi:hypothetical protein CAL22_03780 [Bordetella genomosp. 12]|uniref:Uncharacterized protein n=1 Tax=Bordetella genomosp. 12 TaxID=463035 RepID=A0A261VUE6_9BORD|nr:hypothetical protein CAL22_03780 [Bordetella genomosp. 12]
MQSMDDKQAFAARLRLALKRSPKLIESATRLAVQFSLRHPDAAMAIYGIDSATLYVVTRHII